MLQKNTHLPFHSKLFSLVKDLFKKSFIPAVARSISSAITQNLREQGRPYTRHVIQAMFMYLFLHNRKSYGNSFTIIVIRSLSSSYWRRFIAENCNRHFLNIFCFTYLIITQEQVLDIASNKSTSAHNNMSASVYSVVRYLDTGRNQCS